MIEHLTHDLIDKPAWDARCISSANAHWYGLSSTLDAVAPGWNALVDPATGEQMPLIWRSKWGVRYLYQPFMVQHVGPWSPESQCDIGRFLNAVPRSYRYADIGLDSRTAPRIPAIRFEERRNHWLPLDRPLGTLRAAYSTNHRRSLRKAERYGIVPEEAAADEVVQFLERSAQFNTWGITAGQREAMRRVLHGTADIGTGVGRAVRHDGETVAAAWFVRSCGRVVFLKGLANDQGRQVCAMHALLDGIIAETAGTERMLDLAGGHEEDLARFYSGFGGVPRLYLRALMNRLPPIIRRLKQ